MKPSRQQLLQDLRWAYSRLDHLLTVYDEGDITKQDFAGPDETMAAVRAELPSFRTRYGFKKTWPNGRAGKGSMDSKPNA